MPLLQLIRQIYSRNFSSTDKIIDRITEVVARTWHLGFTAFGGPPAHFQIFHKKFVEPRQQIPWIDEQTYQELFALCQAVPGPASTKFLFATVLLRFGAICSLIAFLIWSLPGAIGMFGLSLGIQEVTEVLPDPVYALLSGLNASTVGIVAVAAVQLSEKCIKDHISRLLVIFGACAGLCYSALWYYPVLLVIGGLVTLIWDLWFGRRFRKMKQNWERRRRPSNVQEVTEDENDSNSRNNVANSVQVGPGEPPTTSNLGLVERRLATGPNTMVITPPSTDNPEQMIEGVSVRTGIAIISLFFVSFIIVLILRARLPTENRALSLFANMYLAGTIIVGGGPVVIPLLREYVVTPGWVTPRDFLIGLAIIQAFPGPNFNFAVYLGALAVAAGQGMTVGSSIWGAVLGFVGIFTPGLIFAVCLQSWWKRLRTVPAFTAILRGVNASAVGLIFTAVYRLWEVGYLSKADADGRSLADEPWWVVVAVLTYSGNKWFKVPAPVGIVAGGALGLAWWGVTQA